MCWNGPALWEECGHSKSFYKHRHDPPCSDPPQWRDWDQVTTFEGAICPDCKKKKKEQKQKEKEDKEREERERKEREREEKERAQREKDENRKNKLDEWRRKHGLAGGYGGGGGGGYY